MAMFTARPETRESLSTESRERLAQTLTPVPEEYVDHVDAHFAARRESFGARLKGVLPAYLGPGSEVKAAMVDPVQSRTAASGGGLTAAPQGREDPRRSEAFMDHPRHQDEGEDASASSFSTPPRHEVVPRALASQHQHAKAPNARRETYERFVHAASDELLRAHGYAPHRWSYRVFESRQYMLFMVLIVIFNVLVIGFESAQGVDTQLRAQQQAALGGGLQEQEREDNYDYSIVEAGFFVVYLADVLLRWHAYEHRSMFLCEGDAANNWLDVFLLVAQAYDLIRQFSASGDRNQSQLSPGESVVLRLSRLLRLTKLKCSESVLQTFAILCEALVASGPTLLLLGILVVGCATSVMVYQDAYGPFTDQIDGTPTNGLPILFRTYSDAVLTFVQFTFEDSTFDRIRPLAKISPFLGGIALFYVLEGSVMIMNLLAGVLTDIAFRHQKASRRKDSLRRAVDLANYLIIQFGEVDESLNHHVHVASKLRSTKSQLARKNHHHHHNVGAASAERASTTSRVRATFSGEEQGGPSDTENKWREGVHSAADEQGPPPGQGKDEDEADVFSSFGKVSSGSSVAPARGPTSSKAAKSVEDHGGDQLDAVVESQDEGSGNASSSTSSEGLKSEEQAPPAAAMGITDVALDLASDVGSTGGRKRKSRETAQQVDGTMGLTIPLSIFYDPVAQRKLRMDCGVSTTELPSVIIAALAATAQAAAVPDGVGLRSVTAMALAEAMFLREGEFSRDDAMQTLHETKKLQAQSTWQSQMGTMMLDLQRLALYAVGVVSDHVLLRQSDSDHHQMPAVAAEPRPAGGGPGAPQGSEHASDVKGLIGSLRGRALASAERGEARDERRGEEIAERDETSLAPAAREKSEVHALYKQKVVALCGGEHFTFSPASTSASGLHADQNGGASAAGGAGSGQNEEMDEKEALKQDIVAGVLRRISKFYDICASQAVLPGEQAKFHSNLHTAVTDIVEGALYHPRAPGGSGPGEADRDLDLVRQLRTEMHKTVLDEQQKNCMEMDATLLRSKLNKFF